MIPSKIFGNDVIEWTESISEYPASQGFTYNYVLINGTNKIEFQSTADGDNHKFSITSADSALLPVGTFRAQAYITKNNSVVKVFSVTRVVIENLISPESLTESHARITLKALEATIQGRATKEQLSYTINGRSMQYMDMNELIKAHTHYTMLVKQEEAQERVNQGLASGNLIKVKF